MIDPILLFQNMPPALAKYILTELSEFVCEFIANWSNCDDNIPISDAGKVLLSLMQTIQSYTL